MAVLSTECQNLVNAVQTDRTTYDAAYADMVTKFGLMNTAVKAYKDAVDAYNALIINSLNNGIQTMNAIFYDVLNLEVLSATSMSLISSAKLYSDQIDDADDDMETARVAYNSAATTYNDSVDAVNAALTTLNGAITAANECIADDISNSVEDV